MGQVSKFVSRYQKIKAWAGTHINGYSLLIDIVDACPMRCPTCPTGVATPRDGHRMDLDTYRRILDKAMKEVRLRKVQLYRWGDPLLHPNLHLFIKEAKARGLNPTTSSVLQAHNCDFEKVLAAGPAEFRISYSGQTYMHVYQRNAKHTRFVQNLEKLKDIPRHPDTRFVMFFHIYKDNHQDIEPARKLAEQYKYDFFAFDATYMLYERIISGNYTEADKEIIARLPETPEENIARLQPAHRYDDFCPMQSKEIVLDSHGNQQLCQLYYAPWYRMGNFLDRPQKEVRKEIMAHPMCPTCKAHGIPGYTLIFGDPVHVKDPVEAAMKGKYK